MKQLIIAEKPSVAGDIAKALGKFKKVEDYYESESYIIASAVGHLVELAMPQDIDPKLKSWNPKTLPILPSKFLLKPIEKSKDKLNTLKKLIARKDVSELINACDAGREGELIFTYIYEITNCKKPFSRLWMQSMTPAAIRAAFTNLRTQAEMLPLQEAARCRSESDWLIGINGTRVLTNKLYTFRAGQVATVGRVQTPTLFMVVEREKEINAFEPKPYWKVIAQFGIHSGTYEGILQKNDFKRQHDEDRVDRIWEEDAAKAILKAVQAEDTANVSEEKKRTTQIAPRLYDLTTLQREANNRCGFSAKRTLQIAQSLYEKHKVITYPRTDAKALPEDYAENCTGVLKAFDGELKESAKLVLNNKWINARNKRVFNNQEVSDHFAIIPTDHSPDKLSDEEWKVYNLIAKRFIAVFYPPAEFDVTTRLSEVGDYTFKTEGKVLVEAGWLAVHGKLASDKDMLPPLTSADGKPPKARVEKAEIVEDVTRPPPRYTEASLLGSMESAGKRVEDEEIAEALKEKGIGTPATRAQIIEHLIFEKYLERDQRDLVPSAKAERLIDYLQAIKIAQLTSPAMTGEWEFNLRQIEQGKLSRDRFMASVEKATQEIVEKTKNFDAKSANRQVTTLTSPLDGEPIFETVEAYCSKDGSLVIPKVIGNRKLELEELEQLLKEKQIGPLDGFRSRFGKPYAAVLKLSEDNKVEFVFGNSDSDDSESEEEKAEHVLQNLKQFPVLGVCPIAKTNPGSHSQDHGHIYETPNAYICDACALKTGECTFRVNRTLLERVIPHEEFVKLITEGKTNLLDKFRSKRTKRFFSAYLVLKDDGQIGFEFEERKAKAVTKKVVRKAKRTVE